jgi:hypothetical protein
MAAIFQRIEFPELFLGFVSPVGADINDTIEEFRQHFRALNYDVVEIKVTDVFRLLSKYIAPRSDLRSGPSYERFTSHISYGNQLRQEFSDDSILSAITIMRIVRERNRRSSNGDSKFGRTVYLLHQFKRKEERSTFCTQFTADCFFKYRFIPVGDRELIT